MGKPTISTGPCSMSQTVSLPEGRWCMMLYDDIIWYHDIMMISLGFMKIIDWDIWWFFRIHEDYWLKNRDVMTHRIHGAAIYGKHGSHQSNPFMLAYIYIPALWIRHGRWNSLGIHGDCGRPRQEMIPKLDERANWPKRIWSDVTCQGSCGIRLPSNSSDIMEIHGT